MAARKNTKEAPAEETTTEETETITVKTLCDELDAEPKAFRSWLRNQTNDRAGRGGRWVFTPEVAEQLKAKYAARAKAKATTPTLKDDAANDADES